jgi:putative transposase
MPNYRRAKLPGGTYFLTQVTHHRQPWLITDIARLALRAAITHVRQKYPFTIDAFVHISDHFHCLWTLPVRSPVGWVEARNPTNPTFCDQYGIFW